MAVAAQPGFIIRRNFARPSADLVSQFGQFASANLSDVMGKANTLDYRIKSIHTPAPQLLGVALTVKARPGDNLMAMKAIDLAQPGDVIVIAGGFDTNYSVWGGIMSMMARKRGVVGVVTDGLVRDCEQIRKTGLVVYASGLTPVGPSKDGRGQIGTPIACGGVIVQPGDVVFGDADGVVIVPQQEAEAVLARAHQRIALEEEWMAGIARDEFVLVDSDQALVARGCQIIE
jgi:regulator of RNase E activity RraA